jgi:hypothetical protein
MARSVPAESVWSRYTLEHAYIYSPGCHTRRHPTPPPSDRSDLTQAQVLAAVFGSSLWQPLSAWEAVEASIDTCDGSHKTDAVRLHLSLPLVGGTMD